MNKIAVMFLKVEARPKGRRRKIQGKIQGSIQMSIQILGLIFRV
jgi:hypothetical protein